MDLNVLEFMKDVVLPIFIVVILPVAIVLIVQIFRNKNLARKTDIVRLAIEKGANLDVDRMMEALDSARSRKGGVISRERYLLERLTIGIILLLAGMALIVITAFSGGMSEGGRWLFYLSGAVIAVVGIGLLIMFLVGRKMLPEDRNK